MNSPGCKRTPGSTPDALANALVEALWEAEFSIVGARKAPRDTVYVAGCLFRAIGVMAQALHGHAHRWTVNEKGIVASAARLPQAPAGFEALAERAITDVEAAEHLLKSVRAAIDEGTPYPVI